MKVSDNKMLEKYTKIWGKISNFMNIKFGSKPVYGDNDKYIKTKIKLYGDKVNTNFQGKKIPKENTSCKCLSLIMLGSVIRANKKYYPQTLLEEFKYEIKKNKMENLIMNLRMDLIMDLIMRLIINFDFLKVSKMSSLRQPFKNQL